MQKTLLLKSDECHTVKADQVFVENGVVWLTQSGHTKDELLYAGQSYRSGGSGKIVVQAFSDNTRLSLRSTPWACSIATWFLSRLKKSGYIPERQVNLNVAFNPMHKEHR